ncbi:MAG: complex I NDUFA9 subunit family protein [Betaproteobacteria bacterium]|nr:complex I NDUFA9 subunit family protein [Betaproteobacteria bacterium]
MDIQKVCVIGGSGFVGRHVVHLLAAEGLDVWVPSRNRERAKQLLVLPTVDVIQADVHDDRDLNRVLSGMHAVINLVGILHQLHPGDFRKAHVELPRRIVAAAKANGISRLVHMSALNADPGGPSEYLRTKGEAEKLVRESGLQSTVFRPSVIFGRDDSFLNLFAALAALLPVLVLACPNARFQPVFVEDVAQAFARSLADPQTFGASYDLCGPKAYTLRELVEYVCRLTGHDRPIIGLGDQMSYLQALFMEMMPIKLMTRDNYRSMKVDNVCHCDFPAVFGFQPAPMETVVPLYLAEGTPRARYRWFRYKARR